MLIGDLNEGYVSQIIGICEDKQTRNSPSSIPSEAQKNNNKLYKCHIHLLALFFYNWVSNPIKKYSFKCKIKTFVSYAIVGEVKTHMIQLLHISSKD